MQRVARMDEHRHRQLFQDRQAGLRLRSGNPGRRCHGQLLWPRRPVRRSRLRPAASRPRAGSASAGTTGSDSTALHRRRSGLGRCASLQRQEARRALVQRCGLFHLDQRGGLLVGYLARVGSSLPHWAKSSSDMPGRPALRAAAPAALGCRLLCVLPAVCSAASAVSPAASAVLVREPASVTPSSASRSATSSASATVSSGSSIGRPAPAGGSVCPASWAACRPGLRLLRFGRLGCAAGLFPFAVSGVAAPLSFFSLSPICWKAMRSPVERLRSLAPALPFGPRSFAGGRCSASRMTLSEKRRSGAGVTVSAGFSPRNGSAGASPAAAVSSGGSALPASALGSSTPVSSLVLCRPQCFLGVARLVSNSCGPSTVSGSLTSTSPMPSGSIDASPVRATPNPRKPSKLRLRS